MAFVFVTPTVAEAPAALETPFDRVQILRGVTVLKNDGVYTQVRYPNQADIESADIAYLGGREYVITETEASLLANAGYAVPGFEISTYGMGIYGTGTYGI